MQLIGQLVKQKSRSDWLTMALELELSQHRDVRALLAACTDQLCTMHTVHRHIMVRAFSVVFLSLCTMHTVHRHIMVCAFSVVFLSLCTMHAAHLRIMVCAFSAVFLSLYTMDAVHWRTMVRAFTAVFLSLCTMHAVHRISRKLDILYSSV